MELKDAIEWAHRAEPAEVFISSHPRKTQNALWVLVAEVDTLTDLIYGEHGLAPRLTAADAGWAKWQIKARELEEQNKTLTHDLATEREEVERLRNVNELDRSIVADGLAGMRRAIKGREWLRLGRGSYEYDDDRWRDEFAESLNAIEDAMKPLETVARNIADCPTTQAGANTARELLTRAKKAEAERDKYKAALESINGARLAALLIEHRIIDFEAIDDANEYDGGATKNGVDRVAAALAEAVQS